MPKRFSVITLFPEVVQQYASTSILGRAQKAGAIIIDTVNPRDFTNDVHKTVDDSPYGGGPGMVMKPEPLFKAVESIVPPKGQRKNVSVIIMDPRGQQFTQKVAHELTTLDHIVLLSGRYEGIDERVGLYLADRSLSIGPYILSGGELASLVIVEAVARLVPGVLGKEESLREESFSKGQTLEYPQYTKPEDFRGYKVPEVLRSGNHALIKKWRQQQSRAA
jgi:tRNA (guanine37-N1)-methyltransferase